MRSVLVAYASHHGATEAVALRLGRTLSECGVRTAVAEVGLAPDPARYDAVVLGSSAQDGRWLPEAGHWGRLHAAQLTARPLFLFSSGPLERALAPVEAPRGALRLAARLGAREHVLFGGCVPPARGPVGRRLVAMVPAPSQDRRDWGAIEDWGIHLAAAVVSVRRGRA